MSADLFFNSGSARPVNTLILTSLSYQEQSTGFLHLPCPSASRPQLLKETRRKFQYFHEKKKKFHLLLCLSHWERLADNIPACLTPSLSHLLLTTVINPCHFTTWSDKFPYIPLNTANSNKLVTGVWLTMVLATYQKKATTFHQPFSVQTKKTLEMDLLLLPQCHISCNSRQSKGTTKCYMESRFQNMWRISPSK